MLKDEFYGVILLIVMDFSKNVWHFRNCMTQKKKYRALEMKTFSENDMVNGDNIFVVAAAILNYLILFMLGI